MTTSPDVDIKADWLRFYCGRGMRIFRVHYITAEGRCSCGRGDEDGHRERDWGKHPVAGFKEVASSDVGQVLRWHALNPSYNWGWLLDDHFVIDIDPRNGGFTPDELYGGWGQSLGFELPVTWLAYTGGGGVHLVFRQPTGRRVRTSGHLQLESGRVVDGIDVKAATGYVLVHPSNHRLGHYRWAEFVEPIEAPAELLELIYRHEDDAPGRRRARTSPTRGGVTELRREGLDLEVWASEAPDVPRGGQRDHLKSGIGWMVNRAWPRLVIHNTAWAVAQKYEVHDELDPWLEHHVLELVADMAERYAPTIPGNIVIPAAFTPQATGAPAPDGPGAEVIQFPTPGDGDADDQPEARLTQVSMKDTFVQAHGRELAWTDELGWLHWTGQRWAQTEHEAPRRYEALLVAARAQLITANPDQADHINRKLDGWESTAHIHSTVDLARKDLRVEATEFDGNPNLLNCPNGVLELGSWRFTAHRPEDRLMKMCGVPYDPRAPITPLLDEFHEVFVPDPQIREFLYRLLGSTLIGGNASRILIFIIGKTSTGKSQFMSAMMRVLGSYAETADVSVFRGHQDERARTDILKVLSARLALLDEGSQAQELHADQVKRLTGRTPIAARQLYAKKHIERVPDFTPIFFTNEPPKVRGADAAIRRRLYPIRFDNQPVVEDTTKRDIFLGDVPTMQALLNELVGGCRRFLEVGLEGIPTELDDLRSEVMAGMDDVTSFIDWAVNEGVIIRDIEVPLYRCVGVTELHTMYIQYVKDHGDAQAVKQRVSGRDFGNRLRDLGYIVKSSNKVRVGGLRMAVDSFDPSSRL